MKKILVLGGTGAMGVYLVPELANMGYDVHVISLDNRTSDNPHITYTQGNALDDTFLEQVLKNAYDAVVDFMLYLTPAAFQNRYELFLKNTGHYIFLSSYRVYADKQIPITETSPRLLEASTDAEFLAREEVEYSLYKAREEDILVHSGFDNWTIVRPAITYSKLRYQLVTLEAPVLIQRMRAGKTVVLPEAAMEVQATMTWAGDVAKMISRLLFNKQAYKECFTVSTAEHHTWREVAEYYQKIGGLQYVTASTEDILNITSPGLDWAKWQLLYDRLFDRVIDNTKILNVTGLKQSELMTLYDGLQYELSHLPKDASWPDETGINQRMDLYLEQLKNNA